MIRNLTGLLTVVALTLAVHAADEPTILFDGTDASAFTHRDGSAVKWKVVDGALEVAGGGDIFSKQTFGDHVLHIEFMVPKLPDHVKGQNRGNSGVYVQGRYEVQVLDSWGLDPGDGDCGAIYAIKAPDKNASKPPGEWQTYEITFRGPRFDESGKKTENARITVVHNGITIHDDFELPSGTPGGVGGESPKPGPLLLQDHGNPVRFRNIRVSPLAEDAPAAATQPSAFEPRQFNDMRPGLVGEYFRDAKSLEALADGAAPFLVRIDPQVQFGKVHGEFYGTKLNNNFAVRWSGVLRIKKPGSYKFGLHSDDKSRVFIGDELFIDNTLPDRNAADKTVYLAAGDYPVRIEYHQGGGSAQVHFGWQPPGATDWRDIPESQLLHAPHQLVGGWDSASWEAHTWDREAWLRDWAPRFIKMDYGSILSHTIKVDAARTVNKGIAIRLGDDRSAAVLFDTELLCFAAGWSGGFLNLDGVAFNGSHGPNPSIEGDIHFRNDAQAGWSGSRDFSDPRPNGLGNLPRQRGHFKGLFRNGDNVVLRYTVGNRKILDHPQVTARDGKPVFRRTIEVGASDREIWLNPGAGAEPLRVPPSAAATLLVVEMTDNEGWRAIEQANVRSPADFCAGGNAQWGQVLSTTGTVAPDDTAYVVDSIGVPEDNPWNSWMRFGGLDFFSDGRASLCTWSGDVWIVSGIDDKLENVQWKRFAAGLFQPLGLQIVDDQIYVLGRDQITRLHDLNGNGEADFYENFNNDCQVTAGFHEFSLDLQTDREGNFYFAKGGPVRPGGRGWEQISDHAGCVLRVSKDGSKLDVFATGVRAPNGMGIGPDGQLSVGDNEGTWTPTCRISFVEQGDFLGVVDLAHRDSPPTTYKPPICWLPHKTVDNSSGGQVWAGDEWGPLTKRMLHMSYGQCALFLVLLDEVDGVAQGGVVKFPRIDFDTGICRARIHPKDGQLYVTGLRGWQTRAARDGALQRVRFTGKPLYMPTDLSIGNDTITIGFPCELDEELAADPDSYAIEQWNYVWSDDYGSPEVSVDDPSKKQHDPVEIDAITVAPDRKSVTLRVPGLRPVMQMKITLKLEASDGTPVEFDIHNTINRVPDAGR